LGGIEPPLSALWSAIGGKLAAVTNPYAAPQQATKPEDDIAAATPPLMARVAGGADALAGLVVALTGVQTLTLVELRAPYAAAPWVLVALGLTTVVLGVFVFRARVVAAIAAIGAGGLLVLASGAWLVLSFTHGLFSLFAMAAPFVATAALVLTFLALGPCQRASAARDRLSAQGMNLGI
jgi:hypothetical protein